MSHAVAFEDRPQAPSLAVASAAGWRPAFLCDWVDATFVHFAVEPRWLQPSVPFELDLYQGKAYVSLVAFTMRHVRPAALDSRLGEMLLRPIMPCRFLNVRTYVRAGGSDGIFFFGEWLSQWANIPLGPLLYGLPYRPGWLSFSRERKPGRVASAGASRSAGAGDGAPVRTKVDVHGLGGGRLAFRGECDSARRLAVSAPGSLDAFLLERYHAFTVRRGKRLVFQVEHAPWRQTAAEISLEETSLLAPMGEWSSKARLVGGHYTPGAFDVAMSAPQAIRSAAARSAFLG